MGKPSEDRIKSLIHSIGLKHGLQDEIVNKIISSPYKFTREKITQLSIDDEITEEEFNKLKKNFIYLYLGRLYTTYDMCTKFYKRRWKKKEI